MNAIRILAVAVSALLPACPAMAQQAGAARELRGACQADVRKHCDNVQPGGGRLLQCLRSRQAELSSACRAALDKLPAR